MALYPRSIALVCLTAAGILLSAPHAVAAAGPTQIGEFQVLGLESDHPYQAEAGAEAWVRVVQIPGATYVRLHFSAFDLAGGDWLEVSGPGGERTTRYAGRGPLSSGEFWAATIPGDSAVITVHAETGGRDGFVIDGAGRGTAALFGREAAPALSTDDRSVVALMSEPGSYGDVCGIADWRDVKCYQSSNPNIYNHARAVVYAIVGCCHSCTAFKVSDTGQFMYSNSCATRAGASGGVQATELLLDYQNWECGGSVSSISGSVNGLVSLSSDPFSGLDYNLFTVTGTAPEVPCLQLDPRAPALGERIYIPQHPNGGPKTIAIASDADAGGMCQIDPIVGDTPSPDTDIGFLCDTTDDSLGAPVISAQTGRVVGISHWGACPNTATRMDQILPRIAPLLDKCSFERACTLVSGGRCDCNGICSDREWRYSNHVARRIGNEAWCADCPSPEPSARSTETTVRF